MIHRFPNTGADWSGLYAATIWLDTKGYSTGQMQRDDPIAILRGDFDIQKWRNLDTAERDALDGTITFDGSARTGTAIVELLEKWT